MFERYKPKIGAYLGKGGMSELDFFAAELSAWKNGKKRREQLRGEAYYRGDQDILRRQRTVIGAEGKPRAVDNLPNHRVVDNRYALMVDQKTNYLVGKPFVISTENKNYGELLRKTFNNRFHRLLKYVCEDALNGGIGWLYPYYDGRGELTFQRFPAYDILPFWADDDHTILDCALRYYTRTLWRGRERETEELVEIFRRDGLYRCQLVGETLVLQGVREDYVTLREAGREPMGFCWDKIPLVAFKYNKQEIPLLNRVKTLQDGINLMLSDFENNMQEDARNTILVLKNYDGENLGEFRNNLTTYGAVKVREDGGVSTLSVAVNGENYKEILDLLRKSLIENARGYDGKDERLSGSPNQMNIQSMYSDIDLDANGMETEFRAAFEELLWFVDRDFANRGLGDFTDTPVQIVFNRDMLMNESETVENCVKSQGILSKTTLIEQHPWVNDVELELSRLAEEQGEL